MSHYPVTVRITAERLARHHKSYKNAIDEMMVPYDENTDRCPAECLKFIEDTESDTITSDIDEKTGKRGYWTNPNAKWDWYLIGGRWRGFFPVKDGVRKIIGEPGTFHNPPDGGSDVVRLADIDMDAVARTERKQLDAFKAEYRDLLAGKDFGYEGPREQAMRIGMIRVEQDPAAPVPPGTVVMPWSKIRHMKGDARYVWRDICIAPTDAELEKYRAVFNPLRTYAALDDAGWHAPGRMGWWGMSSDEPEAYLAYANGFLENFIKPVGPDDLLVVVDCHI